MKSDWNQRFLDLAQHVSSWSKDPSTKVGAVLVSPDRCQVVLGYNGFPRGVLDDEEKYNNKEEKYPRIVHAELNAILNSTVRPVGYTLFVTPLPPCTECTKAIIQSGIKKVIIRGKPEISEKWKAEWKISYRMLAQARVEIHIYHV